MTKKPLVGIVTCVREINNIEFHMAAEKYAFAIKNAAQAVPILIPSIEIENEILDYLDGLLFTGSQSNVQPHHYGGIPSKPGTLHDPKRDAASLPLIRSAVKRSIPLLSICRGHQELNAALGGSLCQEVHELPDKLDHREPSEKPLEIQFQESHLIHLTKNGMLEKIAGADSIMVNSLHHQAIEKLSDQLLIEAKAPDGVIEAVRVDKQDYFGLGVQWHPEWKVMENSFSKNIFGAFGKAAQIYQHNKK